MSLPHDNKDIPKDYQSDISELKMPEYSKVYIPPTTSAEMEFVMTRLSELVQDVNWLKITSIDSNNHLRRINGNVRRLNDFEKEVKKDIYPTVSDNYEKTKSMSKEIYNYSDKIKKIESDLYNNEFLKTSYLKFIDDEKKETTKEIRERVGFWRNIMYIAVALSSIISAACLYFYGK